MVDFAAHLEHDHATAANDAVRGSDFYQYERPVAIGTLCDEVDAPGIHFTGRRARVYWLLRLTKDRGLRHPVGSQVAPPGWVPRHLVVEPWSGGAQGDRRVRELRFDYGVDIQVQEFKPPGGGNSSTTLYRIGDRDPIREGAGRVDLKKAREESAEAPKDPTKPLAALAFLAGEVPPGPPSPVLAFGNSFLNHLEHFAGLSDGGCRTFDVTPGGDSAFAPRRAIATDEAYRELLLAMWGDGSLVGELAELRRAGFVAYVEPGAWSPIPVLSRALVALGARRVEG